MKQKKPLPIKVDSSLNNLFKIAIVGMIVLILFFVLSGRNKTPKIVPEINEQTSICSTESFPVCGNDGKTYTNSCTAEKIANVRVVYVGACRTENTGSIEVISPTESGSKIGSGIENTGSEPIIQESTGSVQEPVIQESTGAVEMLSSGTIVTSSGTTGSASGLIDPTLVAYSNSTYHYSFSMPKNSYYQAFGAQNGASHSVGITFGTGVESLSGSEVRVYFYANKIVGKLSGAQNGFYTDPMTGTVYLLLNNKDSVMIESTNSESILVQTIIRTIHEE